MLLTSPPAPGTAFDVCVVGAGPAGLAVAVEAARAGLRVLLVEAGGAERREMTGTPDNPAIATVVDRQHHASLRETTWSGVGGATWLWGGKCVPFEPVDFAARDYVPYSGWPLSPSDLAPWQDRAAYYLNCGVAEFHGLPIDGWSGQSICTSQRERWSRRPRLGRSVGAVAVAHPAISVLPHAMVTDLRFDPSGRTVTSVRVRHRGREAEVAAGRYVLAAGGLATTRLLLAVQRRLPSLFGGPAGPLGRYYMGHLTGTIATLELTRPDDFADLDFEQDVDGTYVRRRLTLSESAQRRGRILNTSFFLDNLPFGDVRHGNGTLSLFGLLLSVPGLRRRLVSDETLRRNSGPGARARLRHVRNILRQPGHSVADAGRVVWLRFFAAPRRTVFVLRNDIGAYALRYHAEQAPNPHSRVTLHDGVASDGLPGVDIDFSYSEQDVASVLEAHAALDRELRTNGYGRLLYEYAEEERLAAVRDQAGDGYHQIGTTRMSADPDQGVVDADCRVHGIGNLYVASSSVFPTAGEANPTFMVVTLAVRLAHHLAALARAAA